MSIFFQHQGLYFGSTQEKFIREQHEKNPILREAFGWLRAKPGEPIRAAQPDDEDPFVSRYKPELTQIEVGLQAAFCSHFLADQSAAGLIPGLLGSALHDQATLLESLMHGLTIAQTYEMTRSQIKISESWVLQYTEYVRGLLESEKTSFLEEIWMIPLQIALATLTEDEALLADGAAQYRHIIDSTFHPEGFIGPAVQDPEGDTYEAMTLALAALTLAAEAATQSGVDLWDYENRGVGISTAAAYLTYYYYYPEKWRWADALTAEKTRAIFQKHGAFMEILTYRVYVRGIEMMFEEQRPFFGAHMGGLTTLTHTAFQRKKRRWFGF